MGQENKLTEVEPTKAEKAAGAKRKVKTKDGEVTTYETFDWPEIPGR